jgi:hypothetical protein
MLTNGEACVEIAPWEVDPLTQEQGSWNDVSCQLPKPFICQMFKNTVQMSVVVNAFVHLTGGELLGSPLFSTVPL